ncbi:MAG TPA: protein kinase [Thermoanaerobaculia bacterium]|nr:protein kinase [Thermoanaerobaculia bacterium]
MSQNPDPAAPADVGGSIGKYQIVARIGAGGFGTVFRGWDPVIKRSVAIKVCDAGRDVHARFLREAELAGGLHHPNITTIYECGMEGKTPYLVQEFLEGEDLSDLIARKEPMELSEKIKILVGVALGLEYAHRAGVVHRDVKPANLRVLENRVVKIMDFGIAKALDSPSPLTGTGIALGSSAYMAPEQVCGDAIDARTDIFSFGVLAFELLSYQRPFANENLFRLLEMIVKEDPDPPLVRLEPHLPIALVEIVEKAMRKSAEERFPSMREVLAALVAAHPEAAPAATESETSLPEAESERVGALHKYAILDTPPESAFDELAWLAARMCGAPYALISLVAPDRVWVKANPGGAEFVDPRGSGFSTHTLLGRDVMVVPDATADARFRDHPSVAAGLRFYAGAPLVTPDGQAIGTLSVHDREPRELSPEQCQFLRVLASQVVAQLELRRRRRQEIERSGEKLLLEVAGLADASAVSEGEPAHG